MMSEPRASPVVSDPVSSQKRWSPAALTSVALRALLLPGLLAYIAFSAGALQDISPFQPVGLAAQPAAAQADSIDAAAAASPAAVAGWERWLWWPIILYLFWGMAHVCDEYFVRTIDVISERFQIPDDVAGATLMALGCNGPELSLNVIGIFKPSDIGVGAVVGGEVFNVLVIIGTALLATPSIYMPLRLGAFSFLRDVFFYVFSVALLYWTLRDGMVAPHEALTLLGGAAMYITTVIYSDNLRGLFRRLRRSSTLKTMRSISKLSLTDPEMPGTSAWDEDSSDDEASPDLVEFWEEAQLSSDPEKGSVLGIREEFRNRMMDKAHHYEERFVCLSGDHLLVSTLSNPHQAGQHLCHSKSGMVYDPNAPEHQHWHHGGLVNQPVFLNKDVGEAGPMKDGPSAALLAAEGERVSPGAMINEHVCSQAVEVIPAEDILYCEQTRDHKHFHLHVRHHESKAADLGGVITLEFKSDNEAVIDAWLSSMKELLINQRRSTAEPPAAKRSLLSRAMQWVEWFQFPVKFWLELTVPDMDRPDQQHLYPVSFTMSMVWLAIFAFSVVHACDGIHRDFGISTGVLGFTIAAAGTSFPNVFSGMVVAKQGKTTMAVANALGANVQNVFLALAIPWTIQSCFIWQGPFDMKVNGLGPAVLEIYITLLPMLLTYLCCKSLPRWSGALMLATYVVYLVFALGQEGSPSCTFWPVWC